MLSSLRNVLLLRGLLALVVGLVAIAWPGITVGAFVLIFAVYAFLASGIQLTTAFRSDHSWSVLGYVVLALLSAAAGVLSLVWPGATALVLTTLVAIWALATGFVEIALGFLPGERAGERAEWILGGLAFLALGFVLAVRPDLGVLALATAFGLVSMIQGCLLIAASFRTKTVESAVTRLASAA